jgi:hypothetical protein
MPDNTDLLGAISAAVDSAGDPPVTTPEPEDDENAATDDSEVSGAEGGDAGGDSDAGDDSGEDAGDAETGEGDSAEGAKSDAKGKKPAEGAAEVKLDADGKPVKSAEPPKDEKPDPVKQRNAAINDPIDQRLKEGTRNRIQFLANEVKRQDTQLGHANTLFDAVDDTGMSADQLATMLSYARTRNKGTPEEKQQAYGFLKAELRALALELGETTDVDFLAEHADLQAAVEANQITAEYAKEVALSRSRGARDTQHATLTAEQQAAAQAHAGGVQALTTLGNALMARDGAAVYNAKKAVIAATLKPILQSLPPAQWAATFQRAYDAMPKPTIQQTIAAAPATAPKQQPQRPSTPAGGSSAKKEAKSLFDAVSAAVDGDDD